MRNFFQRNHLLSHLKTSIMKSDSEIQQDVMQELKWMPFISSANIGVAVKDGIVTLSGQVDSYAQKLSAENAAKRVAGVRAIAEEMQIGVSLSSQKTDAEIATSVMNALRWHSAVPEEKIKVKVEGGIVTLEGELDWDYQRTSAKNAVSNLLGVRNVVNLLRIQSTTSATDVQRKISAALHRAATVDAQKITVEVSGSMATLRGHVRSFAEKEDAENAAWCAPGISKVESYLSVVPEEVLSF